MRMGYNAIDEQVNAVCIRRTVAYKISGKSVHWQLSCSMRKDGQAWLSSQTLFASSRARLKCVKLHTQSSNTALTATTSPLPFKNHTPSPTRSNTHTHTQISNPESNVLLQHQSGNKIINTEAVVQQPYIQCHSHYIIFHLLPATFGLSFEVQFEDLSDHAELHSRCLRGVILYAIVTTRRGNRHTSA